MIVGAWINDGLTGFMLILAATSVRSRRFSPAENAALRIQGSNGSPLREAERDAVLPANGGSAAVMSDQPESADEAKYRAGLW